MNHPPVINLLSCCTWPVIVFVVALMILALKTGSKPNTHDAGPNGD